MAELDRRPILEPWPGPWAKWASNYCGRQGWKVAHVLGDYEDAMAECAWCYCYCRNKYGATVDNPAWFMHLYKMTVVCRFIDLANKDTKVRELEAQSLDDEEWQQGNLFAPTTAHEGELSTKLSSASSELRQVLGILFDAPREMLEGLIKPDMAVSQLFRAIANSCGITSSSHLVLELKEALSSRRALQPGYPRHRPRTAAILKPGFPRSRPTITTT